MAIASDTREGVLTIRVRDSRMLDENLLEELERDILNLINKTTEERVVLDFDQVQFMSSSMLGKLVKIQKKCKEFKVKLKLSSISPDILQVFKITKLDKMFDIAANEEAARKAFQKRGLFG